MGDCNFYFVAFRCCVWDFYELVAVAPVFFQVALDGIPFIAVDVKGCPELLAFLLRVQLLVIPFWLPAAVTRSVKLRIKLKPSEKLSFLRRLEFVP